MGTKKEKEVKKSGLHFSLVWKITLIALLPLVVLALTTIVVGGKSIQSGMRAEVISKLQALTTCIEGTLDVLDSGDYSLDGQENLIKGNYNLSENMEVLDALVEGDEEFTIFFDDIRRVTTILDEKTGGRLVGTAASDEVYNAVVKNGGIFEAYDIVINGANYYACYAPLENTDGSIVGIVFAGVPSKSVDSFIMEKVLTLVGASFIIAVIALVVVILVVITIRQGLMETGKVVSNFAAGDLKAEISPRVLKRGDELGMIAREVKQLREELTAVLSKVKDSADTLLSSGKSLSTMASQTSATADDISHAVEDISKGAVSQADDIETASSQINDMGDIIEKIVHSVGTLDTTSEELKYAGDKSTEIVHDLSVSNDKTMDAISRIGKQVNATNDSAQKIGEAIEIITSIAEETNLLSLNATIEAARAGEQGRGFAVVANQIQKLAEQSNESAQRVAGIIEELLADSERTVAVMGEVEQIVNEQQEKLEQTKNQLGNVSKGIGVSREEASGIKEQTDVCDVARSKIVDVISNLSAISEENAASTEETTAAMQELNATINLLAEAAASLTGISETLEKEIGFFSL